MAEDADETVGLVRLRANTSAEMVEAELRSLDDALVGSLLEWAGNGWYALAPDAVPLAKNALQNGQDLGLADFRSVDIKAFSELLALRDYQADASAHALAGKSFGSLGEVTVEAPKFFADGEYKGKPVKIDWQFAAVGLPKVWAGLAQDDLDRYSRVLVGHIDTGYTEHPALGFGSQGGSWIKAELGTNFWKKRIEIPSGSGEVDRWSSVAEYPGPRDNLTGAHAGHGTRTGGTLAGLFTADDDAVTFPFFGAAPGASVIPYRITDSVLVDHVPKELAAAINDAVDKGVSVISISMGSIRRDKKVARAVDRAYQSGVIVCAAAGQVVRSVIYPGRFNCVITVGGATTRDGKDFHPWKMAARGDTVDICGPADVIRRPTTISHKGKVKYLIAGKGTGTSFATAICAGLAVLWLAKRSAELDETYKEEKWARVEAFRKLLTSTAITPPGWPIGTYGAGVYNAEALMHAALPAIELLQRRSDA